MSNTKKINLLYFALLKDAVGRSEEIIVTTAETAKEIFEALKKKHSLPYSIEMFSVAVNDEIKNWDAKLNDGDFLVFLPPVSGG